LFGVGERTDYRGRSERATTTERVGSGANAQVVTRREGQCNTDRPQRAGEGCRREGVRPPATDGRPGRPSGASAPRTLIISSRSRHTPFLLVRGRRGRARSARTHAPTAHTAQARRRRRPSKMNGGNLTNFYAEREGKFELRKAFTGTWAIGARGRAAHASKQWHRWTAPLHQLHGRCSTMSPAGCPTASDARVALVRPRRQACLTRHASLRATASWRGCGACCKLRLCAPASKYESLSERVCLPAARRAHPLCCVNKP
jgi:hypothetical protein